LATIFYIDVAAFSIMPKHYQFMLHINANYCENTSPKDIAERWHRLFKTGHTRSTFSMY